MEDYQIVGLLFAAATVSACLSDFWKAFGGPDLRPRPAPVPEELDRGWGEKADLPPFSSSLILNGTDDEFLSALDSQPDYAEIVRENALNKVRPYEDSEFDPDTVARVSRKRQEHEMKMARLRKAGLKLDEY